MHLFAGAGGGLLADLILGHRPIVAVEWDKYCCQVLRERAAGGWFPDLSVWEGDVRLFDPSEYAGKVACIHAGFPCQDISVAGKQAGVSEGTRSGLYREVLRIADTVRPKYIFLENVAAILSNGLGTVLGDLAEMGYDTRWCCLRASDVGAPHHRDRWFCIAYANGNKWSASSLETDERTNWRNHPRRVGALVPNPNCKDVARGGASNDSEGWERKVGFFGLVIGGSGTQWEIEPGLGRVANGVPHRLHRLKALGNAQVPLQAAVAWKLLGGP